MRSKSFLRNTSPPIRLALIILPAVYVSHLVNDAEQQQRIAEQIVYTKRYDTNPSPIPNADVRDEILTLSLQQKENENVGVVAELGLKHRLSNAVSGKPQYMTKEDWKKRTEEMDKVRERMTDKLQLHKKGMATIAHEAANN